VPSAVGAAGHGAGEEHVVLDDAGAVHGQAVVEVAERFGLTPHDGADHWLGRGDPEDAPLGVRRVGFEHELVGLHLGERAHPIIGSAVAATSARQHDDADDRKDRAASATTLGSILHGHSLQAVEPLSDR